jgi:hypothetical protein
VESQATFSPKKNVIACLPALNPATKAVGYPVGAGSDFGPSRRRSRGTTPEAQPQVNLGTLPVQLLPSSQDRALSLSPVTRCFLGTVLTPTESSLVLCIFWSYSNFECPYAQGRSVSCSGVRRGWRSGAKAIAPPRYMTSGK